MVKLEKKYQDALEEFISKHKKNKNVIGIFLTGSFVHSSPDKNSDLDVFILLKDSKIRERGNTWIKDIEIEYFMNPIKQVEFEFKTGKEKHTAHMFANSVVLYEKGKELRLLIKEAKRIMHSPLEKFSKVPKEIAVYQIDDLEKDLEDTFIKKDIFSFNSIANNILNTCLTNFAKIKRTLIEKPKRLKPLLLRIDPNFCKLYGGALCETNFQKKYDALIALIHYTEGLLGGKRPKEWKLVSKCPYLEKK